MIEKDIPEDYRAACYLLILKAIIMLRIDSISELTLNHTQWLTSKLPGIIGHLEDIVFARAERNHVPYLEFQNFVSHIYSRNSNYIKFLYRKVLRRYSKYEDFILDSSQEDITGLNPCYIYWARYHSIPLASRETAITVGVYNAKEMMRYFNMADNTFFEAVPQWLKGSHKRIEGFYKYLVRALMYYGVNSVYDLVNYDLRGKGFRQYQKDSERYHVILFKIFELINGKEDRIRRIKKPQNKVLIEPIDILVDEFLTKRYRGSQQQKQILSYLSMWVDWIKTNYYPFKDIKSLPESILFEYRDYLKTIEKGHRAKSVRYIAACMLISWCNKNNSDIRIIIPKYYSREFSGISVPRMFKTRDHAIRILQEAFKYEPQDEYRYLAKNVIILGFATGIRLSEIIWLGPDCYNDGEIFVQIREKQGQINKPASIYPYGILIIEELIKRFESRPKVMCYNEKMQQHMYILFEVGQHPLNPCHVHEVMKDLINRAGLIDDTGKCVDYKNIKVHATRHQKLSDIYEISDCSLTAAKMESGHKSIQMLEVYTQQQRNKIMRIIAGALEQGRITGKGADIVKAIFSTTTIPDRFAEFMAKMNLVELSTEQKHKIVKDIGFGYCFDTLCPAKICVSCDWYFACKENIPELRQLYINNCIILIQILSQDGVTEDNSLNIEALITTILYSRKWLIELGVEESSLGYFFKSKGS